MKRLDQQGNLIVDTVLVLLLIVVSGLAVWAYQGRQDYKNNVDQKVTAAIAVAKQQESTAKDKQFAETEKLPLRAYHGPEAYGSMVISFPKTWSGYVDESGNGSATVDGYFAPGVVPALTDQKSTFALRVQVVNQSYDQVVKSLSGSQQGGKATVAPFAAPKVASVVGVRVKGQIKSGKTGDMVVLPLRDKTLELWTESSDFENDFNNYILPNFTFSP